MTSDDVLHASFVGEFRVKMDGQWSCESRSLWSAPVGDSSVAIARAMIRLRHLCYGRLKRFRSIVCESVVGSLQA